MKSTDFSKQADISHESELVHYFRQLVDADPDLQWHVPPQAPSQDRLSSVELRLDDRSERFKPLYFLRSSIRELESRVDGWDAPNPPLLVVPELSPRVLELCRQKRLAAIDLNGRAYIRVPGLLVDRGPLPGRHFRFQLEPRNVFVGKSARIIRTLLTDRDRAWTQRELVDRTQASQGLVSRILQHLTSQGFIEKKGTRAFRPGDPLGLIGAWVKADDFARRNTTTRYTALGGAPLETARQLKSWADQQSVRIAFTQWIAGWLRHPYTEPVIASAYVASLPETATLERLGLRSVNDAGKVWLHVPDDDGVFLETQKIQDLPLASDAQIYLDLQQTGLRGPDQADALRNWEGFCRP
ncbi:MAG TPA: helix-turn-helix domain-containing protein [Candidatus Binatia bacterium]|nr:helix-turn-helix domain-containing protein [Candidatus Binatia bacterium]